MLTPLLRAERASAREVQVGVIGVGHFATAVITQSRFIAGLQTPIIADRNLDAARLALQRAHVPDEDIRVCESRQSALAAMEQQKHVIVQDALLLMDLPLDVIVESTGVPEAGARHAHEAIRHGKHVAMVSKETDATVGPMLAHLAERAGLVYTPVDGDQHGLLIELVTWARALGLEVVCGGKARDAEFVYNRERATVRCGGQQIQLNAREMDWLHPLPVEQAAIHLHARQQALAPLPQVGGFDLVEMAITANATGLMPDRPYLHAGEQNEAMNLARRLGTDARLTNRGAAHEDARLTSSLAPEAGRLHCPPLHIAEIPHALCPVAEGGILHQRGVIEAVTCLRQPHEAGLGGGVFIVVACENDYSRHILTTKGLIANPSGTTALIYRPYHLCGVETPISILNAGLLGAGTGDQPPQPRVDVIMRTTQPLNAGETLGNDHSPQLEALMATAAPVADGNPLPLHMGNGNRLRVDLPAGTIITAEMVEPPPSSALWALRRQQDHHFLGHSLQ